MRVLIVEDSEDDAVLLARELKRAANDVTCKRVDSPQTMQAALAADDWDLVISDHAMAQFGAESAYDVLHRCGKDIPFIIYSGNVDEHTALDAMTKGVRDCVQKGNVARLLPVLRRELKSVAQVRALARAESRLHRLAHYDQLTGLPNRQLFYDHARRILQACSARRAAVLLVVDVDRFMRINDTFGYGIGDQLVRQVATRLQHSISAHGAITRLGRDDFALLDLAADNADAASALAGLVMRAFARPFIVDGKEIFLTVSIGVCRFPQDGEDIGRLLVNAENAMVLAKRGGRNNFRVYAREMNSASAQRLQLETELRHAVSRNELLLHYQPSIDVAKRAITAVEALVRWQHPSRGLVPPDQFIPLADETGLIGEIGRWVLFEACAQTKRWLDAGIGPLRVSVNVSAVQFRQDDLAEVVRGALARTGLPAPCLDLEITESVLMHDAEATIATLRGLKRMGVSISVDDFGTGYSSLAYLQRFPIDTLKIDKSFMRGVTEDEHDAAIVRTVIALAKCLRLESIAEGVESRAQIDYLKKEGCDRLQGYYLSRPLGPSALADFIRGPTVRI
jgi:diguanylate cyclase (GGDEF)-like protein